MSDEKLEKIMDEYRGIVYSPHTGPDQLRAALRAAYNAGVAAERGSGVSGQSDWKTARNIVRASRGNWYEDLSEEDRDIMRGICKALAQARQQEPPGGTDLPYGESDLLDLLSKMDSGEGGTRTGVLKRRGWLTWSVTERGRAVLRHRGVRADLPKEVVAQSDRLTEETLDRWEHDSRVCHFVPGEECERDSEPGMWCGACRTRALIAEVRRLREPRPVTEDPDTQDPEPII